LIDEAVTLEIKVTALRCIFFIPVSSFSQTDILNLMLLIPGSQNEDVKMQQPIYMYRTQDGKSVINFELVDGKIAMTYQNIARLFAKDVNSIIEHVNNIFNDGELDKNSLARKFRAKLEDGRMKDLWHFDLKVVLAVGMRVSSQEGTIFRQWAIEHLHGIVVRWHCYFLYLHLKNFSHIYYN
jgi:hypothetical protein